MLRNGLTGLYCCMYKLKEMKKNDVNCKLGSCSEETNERKNELKKEKREELHAV